MQEPSIFTRIINGEIPGEVIYQDDRAVVILSIEPLAPGHCLVIPRQQIDHLWDCDDDLYHHLMALAKRVAERQRTVYAHKRIGSIVEGFGVPHAHIHVFGLDTAFEPTIIEHAANKVFATPEQLAIEAEKLRFS